MYKFFFISILLFFIISCKEKNNPQPEETVTVLEGRVLNADNSTPVGSIALNLYALYKNDESQYSTRLYNVNPKGEYFIEFKASVDSAYAIEIANAPTWYQDTYPYNSPLSAGNSNFQRDTKQTKDIWVCGAGNIQVVAIDSSRINCDTLEVQSIYRNCSLTPNYRYELKTDKSKFKNIEPFLMPSPQKPVMVWKAYKSGRVVFEKRDTITLTKQGETYNYRIVY